MEELQILKEIESGNRKQPLILIVDDIPETSETIASVICQEPLINESFKIERAESSSEAIEILNEELKSGRELAIIITDQRLGEGSGDYGHKFLEQARKLSASTFNIIYSGQMELDDMGSAVNNASLFAYFKKPWDNNAFRTAVSRAAQSYLQQRENELLTESLKHMAHMIAVVAHDIRSPLSGVQELAKLISENSTNANFCKRYSDIIIGTSSNVLKLANDILDMAKLESGGELQLKTVDLQAYLKSLMPSFEASSTPKKQKLTLEAPAKVEAQADENRLSQAIANIVNNCIKFTPENGSITLKLDTHSEDGKNFARIQIQDTGVGMTDDVKEKIFKPFAVTRKGTKGEKGTGLGMSIVKEIVEKHGGRVKVDSQVGKGSTFTILIPR